MNRDDNARDSNPIADYQREYAQEQLTNTKNILLRAAEEINRYSQQYDTCTDDSKRADVMNWSINYLVTGILSNLRIDLLAKAQANLTVLASKAQQDIEVK